MVNRKFRWSIDDGATWTYEEGTMPYNLDGVSMADSVIVEPIGAAVEMDAASPLTILMVGSSTPQRYFSDYTGPSNGNVTASSNGTTFTALGTTGAGACYLGNYLSTALRRPVRFIKGASGGTTLAQWEAADSSLRSAAVAAAIAAGGVDLIVSIVGFNDVHINGNVVSQASHLAKLRSFIGKMRSEIGQPDVPVLIGTSQKYNGSDWAKQQQMVWVRGAEMQAADDANNRLYAHAYDVPQNVDGIHIADAAAYDMHAQRGAAQIVALLRGTTQARGPRVVSAAYVDNTTTDVTIQHVAGSDFTPTSGETGWFVSVDGFSTLLNVSAAVRINATTIRLMHASTGGYAPKVAYGRTGAIDVTGVVRDNSALALPLDPVVTDTQATGATIKRYAIDTFSVDGALFGSTSDTGEAWTQVAGGYTKAGGSAYNTIASSTYTLDFTPLTADYDVEDEWEYTTALSINDYLAARLTDANNYIYGGYNSATGNWQVTSLVGGTVTIHDAVAATLTPGQSYRRRLSVRGNTKELYVDGALVCTADVATITAVGKAGIRNSNAVATSTTGSRRRSFKIIDA